MRSAAFLALVAVACGGTLPPPKRRVIESDVEGWVFGRFQPVNDVEVYIPDNAGRGFTASYARDSARRRGQLTDEDVVHAFVTEYATSRGVTVGLIRFARRLAQESGYVVDEKKVEGQRVFAVDGFGETWVFWSSGKFLVKLGGRGLKKVPGDLVEAYGRHYPSKIRSGALDAPLPEEPDESGPGPKKAAKP